MSNNGTPSHLIDNLLRFGRVCKLLGMDVTPNRMSEVAQALAYIDLSNRSDVYHTMRALIVSRRRDLPLFEQAFELFWARPTEDWTELELPELPPEMPKNMRFDVPPGLEGMNGNPDPMSIDDIQTAIVPTYSEVELLRRKDFADMNADELAAAKRAMDQLPPSLGIRRTRRFRSGKGNQIDLRRVLQSNLRNQGEILTLPTMTPRDKPRPLVLICDISGSMERYTRVFLHFMHSFASSMDQVESFVFSVRLSRITRQIRHKSIDQALHTVGLSVNDWGGGTRTGEALREFNFRWSRRVLGRGAIVLLITDGWDRGDPDLLSFETRRLQRSCHRLIWLNPLLDLPDYEPLTRGAQAILPYSDDFLPLRNLANLEDLVKALQSLDWHRTKHHA